MIDLSLSIPSRISRLLVLAAVLAVAGCQDSGGAPADGSERASLLVAVAPVEAGDAYSLRREFIGRVEAARASDLGFELPGELRSVAVDEGDEVAAGAVLARLDTARLGASLAEARAALEQAESAADLAAKTLARHEEAFSFDGVSAQELDFARDAAHSARARVTAAAARVNAVEVDIAKSRLVAPYDAVVVARRVDEGSIVAAGQPVLRLQERAAPEVRIGVAGELSAAIEPGETRSVTVDGVAVEGVVKAVLPVRDPRTRTVDLVLTLQRGSPALPGDLARLTIDEPVEEAGFRLPAEALAEGSRGLWTAYVARRIERPAASSTGATHYLEPRAVEVLQQDGRFVYVRGALSDGERVVASGLQRVVPYQEVRVAEDLRLTVALEDAS